MKEIIKYLKRIDVESLVYAVFAFVMIEVLLLVVSKFINEILFVISIYLLLITILVILITVFVYIFISSSCMLIHSCSNITNKDEAE